MFVLIRLLLLDMVNRAFSAVSGVSNFRDGRETGMQMGPVCGSPGGFPRPGHAVGASNVPGAVDWPLTGSGMPRNQGKPTGPLPDVHQMPTECLPDAYRMPTAEKQPPSPGHAAGAARGFTRNCVRRQTLSPPRPEPANLYRRQILVGGTARSAPGRHGRLSLP